MKLRIGSRKSKLALIQTEIAIKEIQKKFPEAQCEIIPISTRGDEILDKNLYDIGGKALFLKELEEQLISGSIDIAVHSLKDVPGVIDDRLEIAAILQREDPRDCFISHKYKSIRDLPTGAIIGTSSVRRKAILLAIRPDLKFIPFRGNVQTRLDKLQNNQADATILALAGLKRLDAFDAEYCFPLQTNEMLPAAGQGAICLQTTKQNKDLTNLCQQLSHPASLQTCTAERGFLTYLDASCKTPIAAYAKIEDNKIIANYMLANEAADQIIYKTASCNIAEHKTIGLNIAKNLKTEFTKQSY